MQDPNENELSDDELDGVSGGAGKKLGHEKGKGHERGQGQGHDHHDHGDDDPPPEDDPPPPGGVGTPL